MSFVLSWLNLAQEGPGGASVLWEAFAMQGLVFEMELFLHGLGQAGSWFLNKILY